MAKFRPIVDRPNVLPNSTNVVEGYPMPGLARCITPPCGYVVSMLAMDANRAMRWALVQIGPAGRSCPELAQGDWRAVTWVTTDGWLPFGPLNRLDLDLVEFRHLSPVHVPTHRGHSTLLPHPTADCADE